MTVTVHDVGRTVRWTEGDKIRTGELIRYREPGSPRWWDAHGKAQVLITVTERAIPVEGYRQYVDVHPSQLEVVDDQEEVVADG